MRKKSVCGRCANYSWGNRFEGAARIILGINRVEYASCEDNCSEGAARIILGISQFEHAEKIVLMARRQSFWGQIVLRKRGKWF